jgi:tripartite-type tricarboxylate transporter receptor subunit TctC
MRGLLTTTPERLKEYPDIPTARELDLAPMEDVMGWSGLWGPPGLPKDVVDKWVEVLKKVAQDPDWLRGNASFGGIPAIRSLQDTEKFAREQFELYERLGTQLGLKK